MQTEKKARLLEMHLLLNRKHTRKSSKKENVPQRNPTLGFQALSTSTGCLLYHRQISVLASRRLSVRSLSCLFFSTNFNRCGRSLILREPKTPRALRMYAIEKTLQRSNAPNLCDSAPLQTEKHTHNPVLLQFKSRKRV